MPSIKSALAILATVLPAVLAISGNGRTTYYGTGGGGDASPQTNYGSCGIALNKVPSQFAALNAAQYDGGAHCGKCVRLSYGGRSTVVQIVDLCPSCGWGALDIALNSFASVTGSTESAYNLGVINTDWYEVSCSELGNSGSYPSQPTNPPTNNGGGSSGGSSGSTDRCGPNNGNAKCASGLCCSQYGWCGNTSEHCAVGSCLHAFGTCANSPAPTTTKKTTTTTKKPTTTTTKPPTSTLLTVGEGKRCGARYSARCSSGLCCSTVGYCGKTSNHCNIGFCQHSYGTCASTSVKYVKEGERCGAANSNAKCGDGSCCSRYGWCGRTDAHCGKGNCLASFGKCT
ncbi:hypothetical protein HK097_001986 [Rhizophlyctis rosea]|uniref:Chitin-binding type-1 domain-containing protein n=1 Tax=Rhizophlyctis rosea TaxID=64517 RepID=A0AAD5X3C9_9FUNG|nr:hypothetical protein HK097_001986 [Rhizophlyctis rosea]